MKNIEISLLHIETTNLEIKQNCYRWYMNDCNFILIDHYSLPFSRGEILILYTKNIVYYFLKISLLHAILII